MSATGPQPIGHYENFPVASWLCPPRLRAPIAAIYHFARTADDIADEGNAPAAQRLAELAAYRAELLAAAAGTTLAGSRWPQVFGPLAAQISVFALPLAPLQDLLSAFEQDVTMTADGAAYPDMAALLQYCRRSANPIGRLLLHLYGVSDAPALAQSDAICTALQLINFWQDLSVDIPRGRFYLPLADCAAHGIAIHDPATQFPALQASAATRGLIRALADQARAAMLAGAPLVHRLSGRTGWELRAVVQGGLRVLDHIAALNDDTLSHRPTLRRRDGWMIAARALAM